MPKRPAKKAAPAPPRGAPLACEVMGSRLLSGRDRAPREGWLAAVYRAQAASPGFAMHGEPASTRAGVGRTACANSLAPKPHALHPTRCTPRVAPHALHPTRCNEPGPYGLSVSSPPFWLYTHTPCPAPMLVTER